MEKPEKPDTAKLLRKGLRELADHRPDKALDSLRRAVDAIPPACSEELSHALYWLSVALLRLDKRDLAVKSLSSAQKLRRRSYARSMYLRSINEYGMPKQPTAELDDFYAFMNIQLAAYLSRKPRKRFDYYGEREAVFGLLLDAWKSMKSRGYLRDSDCGQKLSLFRRVRPSFPNFGLSRDQSTLVSASFGVHADLGRGAGIDQRCVCGSGLSFGQCCGRIKSVAEL